MQSSTERAINDNGLPDYRGRPHLHGFVFYESVLDNGLCQVTLPASRPAEITPKAIGQDQAL